MHLIQTPSWSGPGPFWSGQGIGSWKRWQTPGWSRFPGGRDLVLELSCHIRPELACSRRSRERSGGAAGCAAAAAAAGVAERRRAAGRMDEGSNSSGDELAVGCILAIKTTLGEEFEGQVITFDRPSNILVIQEGGASKAGPRRNVRLLKANYIKEFSLLGRAEDPLDLTKCYLDLAAVQAREDAAIRCARFPLEEFVIFLPSFIILPGGVIVAFAVQPVFGYPI